MRPPLTPLEILRSERSTPANLIQNHPLPEELKPLIEAICANVEAARPSSRGVSDSMRDAVRHAATWLINRLRICAETIPVSKLSLSHNANHYLMKGIYKGKVGYTPLIEHVLPRLIHMGLVHKLEGIHVPGGRGVITRVWASQALKNEFRQCHYYWTKPEVVTDLQELILLKDENKILIPTPINADTEHWASNLIEINEALSEHSICLWLSDARLKLLGAKLVDGEPDEENSREQQRFVDFRKNQLRRIFARGRLDRGGRFYGPWWQCVRSEYRPHIVINGYACYEFDYSTMALRLLYAKDRLPYIEGDAYDLGIGTEPEKRRLIKKFVNAILNDESGTYRMDLRDYQTLGHSHDEIQQLVQKRHSKVAHYFGTGIGLELQYLDSCIAEEVMLNMIRGYNLAVLPIHDSFLVKSSHKTALANEMQEVFERLTGAKTELSFDKPLPDPDSNLVVVDGIVVINPVSFTQHIDYSITHNYINTNPNAAFYG